MKMNKMMILVMLATMASFSVVQGMMNPDIIIEKIMPKAFIGFCGWTGLSAATFAGKEVYTKWSNIYPENKEHYAKIARRYKITSRIAAIPLLSAGATMLSCIPGALLEEKTPEFLCATPSVLVMPLQAMTLVPAILHTRYTNPEAFGIEKADIKE